ncbi:MAG TPA: riboflavin synthase [Gemmatimonadaceae bacterium]|nr:riboflavin synthase [Gemmatimonadaceae bacterium]
MFTGLVDDLGTLDRVARTGAGLELRIRCRYDDLAEGESVAVNGVCLTVTGFGREREQPWFTTAAMSTTVGVTTIGSWKEGRRVNLERALRPTDRLGGHIVQGHVDGVAEITGADATQDALLLELALPDGLAELMVERGSVALDGVSLTVSALPGPDKIQVSIIDYTRGHTTLGGLAVGDKVHVEADVLAKHVKRLLGRPTSGV